MGVKTEMPKTATLVGERRIDCGIVQKHGAAAGIALVLFIQGVNQARRHRRAIALQNVVSTAINGCAEAGQRLFGLAFAVIAFEHQLTRATGQMHATALVDALDRHHQIAISRLAGVAKRAAQALNHGELNGFRRCQPSQATQSRP